MAIDTFVSGAYTATYAATATGISESGYELEGMVKEEMINQSDVYGMTTLDWIWLGADAFIQYTSLAYKAGSYAPMWPWGGGTLGTFITAAMPIGELASEIAAAFVLTSTANTPAATAPASLTATKSLLAPGFQFRLLYSPRLRKLPVRLQLLPTNASGVLSHFSQT